GRLLFTPDEIMRLPENCGFCFNPDEAPWSLRPIDYWNLQNAFSHLQREYPKLYWDPPLEFDANPYAEGDKGSGPRTNGAKAGGSSGQGGQSRSTGGGNGRMTAEQAREILGVGPKATDDEILKAYRELMMKIHPDHGGSTYFAKELNAAKAVLCGE